MASEPKSKSVEEKKKEDSIKYLYFSRYLMVRYFVIIFLFTNILWLFILVQCQKWTGIAIAGIITLFSALAAIEQLTKMYNRKLDVPITRWYFWIQMAVNVLFIGLVFTPVKKEIFPFITSDSFVYLLITILLAGIFFAYICERRIHNINIGKDKYKKAISTFEKV